MPSTVFMLASVATPRRRLALPFVLAAVVAALFNLPHIVPESAGIERWPYVSLLASPALTWVGNTAVAVLALWGLLRLLRATSGPTRLAHTLERRRDYIGAAEVYLQAKDPNRALRLYRKARAWEKGAKVALELGRREEAADLLRRAGGRELAEAARLYRQLGDRTAAIRCDHDLAEWLTAQGRVEEAIEAWLRAGQPQRAVRTAALGLSEGRLQPSNPGFVAARRAAEEIQDHPTLARLYEAEGNWRAAAYAWRDAGEHGKAAENFRKISQFEDAAAAEAAAGHPRQAAELRLQQLKRMEQKLRVTHPPGTPETADSTRIRAQLRQQTDSLIPELRTLGMSTEMIDLLRSTGRTEEAVARLIAENEDSAAADLARDAEEWELAAPILERLNRWSEAADVHELAGNLKAAARCAERAGEDERALQIYRSLGMIEQAAGCLARLGGLQAALRELHRAGKLEEACQVLQQNPGPVPDVPEVVLDMAEWSHRQGNPARAIACLQRAVVGVALRTGRLDPAVALARLLHEAGEGDAALAQLDRVLAADYSYEPAQTLRQQILASRKDPVKTHPSLLGEAAEAASAAPQRYEILTELGRGGMGVVYKARDTRLERDVAIKVLRTTSPQEVARLEQEAKAAATLNHPGIVVIYDFEAGFDGYFIAMEYVPGEGLDELLRSQPQRIRTHLVGIMVRLADAMAYAHSRHVIHRDLKPGNILLTPLQEVKILDFGIAARLDTVSPSTPSVCGTPYYMAPEQIRGEAPTPATDVYAFGATTFHLATGFPPFREGNVIEAHLKTPPPDPREQAPDLDPKVAAIILRCLEKEPGGRFTSAHELRDTLLAIRTS